MSEYIKLRTEHGIAIVAHPQIGAIVPDSDGGSFVYLMAGVLKVAESVDEVWAERVRAVKQLMNEREARSSEAMGEWAQTMAKELGKPEDYT